MSDEVKTENPGEVKMTLGHALVLKQAIEAIETTPVEGKVTPRKLPFKIRARLSRMKDLLGKDLEAYEAERQRLILEYGKEEEKDGQKVTTVSDPDSLAKFYKALDEVLTTEIDPGYKLFTKDEIALIDDL